jgi:hypothetical protein
MRSELYNYEISHRTSSIIWLATDNGSEALDVATWQLTYRPMDCITKSKAS